MRIKTKASLLSFSWLIAILLPIMFVIYFFYAKFEKEEAMEALQDAANEITAQLSPVVLLQANNNRVLNKYLPQHATIRIIDTSSTVINQVSNTADLVAIPAQYSEIDHSYTDTFRDQTILIVRTPLRQGTDIVGTLEIISEPIELEQQLNSLIIIICFVAIGAIMLSFSGSLLLSRLLFLPLSRMTTIMKEIETSLAIKKLPMDRKSKDELYQLSETFNHMMERIEMSMHKQQQFISDASHEFKTSITIIEGYTSLIRRWGFENLDLHMEAIEAVHAESQRMKQVTNQLLELAELEQETRLTYSQFDLVTLCKETIQLLQPLSTKEIQLITSENKLLLEADLLQMKQVLLITLDNALKYVKQLIMIHLEHLDSHTGIRIVDDGIGIPAEELPFIFDRFYRVDRSRSRQTGGSGLGLAIAKSIVNLHKGTIQIKSERDMGTEVIIAIPTRKPFNTHS